MAPSTASLSSSLPSTPPPAVPLPSVPSSEREPLPPLKTHHAPLFTRVTTHPPLNHLRRVKSKSSKASSPQSPHPGGDSPPSPTPTYTSALQPAPTYHRPLPTPRPPVSASPSAPALHDEQYLDSPSPAREAHALITGPRAPVESTELTERDRDADLKREKLIAAAQLQERWASTEENVPGYEPAEVLALDAHATARLQGPSPLPSHGSASTIGPDSEKWMQDKASIDKWRKDQIKGSYGQASSPPPRPPKSSERGSDDSKTRGHSRMTNAEIAQHHFREAQKHLEMAQRLAVEAATRQSSTFTDSSSVYDDKPETPRSHAESSDETTFDDLRSAYRSTTCDEPFALESSLRPDSQSLPAGYHTLGHSVSNSQIINSGASARSPSIQAQVASTTSSTSLSPPPTHHDSRHHLSAAHQGQHPKAQHQPSLSSLSSSTADSNATMYYGPPPGQFGAYPPPGMHYNGDSNYAQHLHLQQQHQPIPQHPQHPQLLQHHQHHLLPQHPQHPQYLQYAQHGLQPMLAVSMAPGQSPPSLMADSAEFHGFRPRLPSSYGSYGPASSHPPVQYANPPMGYHYIAQHSPAPFTSLLPPPAPIPVRQQTLPIHQKPLQYDHSLGYTSGTQRSTPAAPVSILKDSSQHQLQHSSSGTTPTNGSGHGSGPNTPPLIGDNSNSSSPSHGSIPTRVVPNITVDPVASSEFGLMLRPPSVGSTRSTASGLKGRMLSLRDRISSPHVRFKSPTPEDWAEGDEKDRAIEGRRRDLAVRSMEETFRLLM